MAKGSCMCGEMEYEVGNNTAMKLVCHCLPCQKTSGTTGSLNFVYPDDQFKFTKGMPKTFQRIGDSGKPVTYYFCPTCPTLLNVKPDVLPGTNVVKLGTLDDTAAKSNPEWNLEIYNKHRLPQCEAVAGAGQEESYPERP